MSRAGAGPFPAEGGGPRPDRAGSGEGTAGGRKKYW